MKFVGPTLSPDINDQTENNQYFLWDDALETHQLSYPYPSSNIEIIKKKKVIILAMNNVVLYSFS
jgi:hypothetical protein